MFDTRIIVVFRDAADPLEERLQLEMLHLRLEVVRLRRHRDRVELLAVLYFWVGRFLAGN